MKNSLIKSTFILIIGGFLTKILGMLIKIVLTRSLTLESVGKYSLIMPTFSLLISIASLGMPVAISKLVSEDKKNNKTLLFSVIPISLIINIVMFFIVYLLSDFISTNLLNDFDTKLGIISIGLVLPFISISSILRGYFFGKEKMIPHVISNFVEDVIRLLLIYFFTPYFLTKGISYAISFIILTNIISESSSILILLLFLPKNFKLNKSDLKFNKLYLKDTLSISLPTTISRLIGNIGYFLEPIIITNILVYLGYTNNYIVSEYGIIEGYIMPMLLLPSFFSNAISQAIIPVISRNYANNRYDIVKSKIKQGIKYSLLIGIPCTLIFMFIPNIPLKFIYNTNLGINYIKVLAPIFILYYIQSPISASIQAMGFAKECMYTTFISQILKLIVLILGCFLNIGLYGLIIAIIFNIVFTTTVNIYKINKILK